MSAAPAFWDSSILVTLCVRQQASPQSEMWAEQFPMVVWWATLLEIRTAFARLTRSGELQLASRITALEDLQAISRSWREIQPVNAIRDRAVELLDLYPLRAADSLQLAAALIWCRDRPGGRTFICADDRLSDAAAQAGFSVLGP